ncbi:MAG: radical SAM protein [Desulfobacterales bacterium]|nr:radical SAM protein [Desulfobacterales bacterium]
MLLIHPPVAKPCEPPVGIATLAGALKAGGASVRVLDAGTEALLFLMDGVASADDTWTRRALRHRQTHRQALVRWPIYAHRDRYGRAVLDLNRLLEAASRPSGVRVGLADYHDGARTPVRSQDLLTAAHDYKKSVFYPYFQARVGPIVTEDAPAWVGISLNYLSQALPAFALIGFLRHGFPRTRIIIGGGLVTSWMSRPDWQNPFAGLVDRVVAGPGEDLLLELCGKDPGQEEGSLPDFDAFFRSGYLAPGPVLPYAASRGCYWSKCAFCPERAEGRGYRPRAPRQVIADLHALCDRHRPALIHLVDNALSPALMGALADHPTVAPWYGFARVSPQLADPEFCRALKRSGCVMIKLGLESGDADVLRRMGKGIDPTQAAAVLGALNRAGIATYVYLLFGTPWEDEAAAERTLEFTAAHADTVDFLNLAVFNLPAHSPEAAALTTRSFYAGDLNLYSDFVHPAGWSRGRVRRFLEKRFRRQPAIASILRRQPPLFTSNHAPLAVMARNRQAR